MFMNQCGVDMNKKAWITGLTLGMATQAYAFHRPGHGRGTGGGTNNKFPEIDGSDIACIFGIIVCMYLIYVFNRKK